MTSVSVIVPVWNRAHSVPAAIDSVLAQQLPAGWSVQVIVVDDGSTDDLVGALRPYGSGVTCIRRERNGGAAAARNTGLGAARGDYVAFLDSDDVWLPGKLTSQIDAMRKNNWPASCTAYYLSRPGRPEIVSPLYQTGAIGLADMVWGCFVSPGSTLMFERGTGCCAMPAGTRSASSPRRLRGSTHHLASRRPRSRECSSISGRSIRAISSRATGGTLRRH